MPSYISNKTYSSSLSPWDSGPSLPASVNLPFRTGNSLVDLFLPFSGSFNMGKDLCLYIQFILKAHRTRGKFISHYQNLTLPAIPLLDHVQLITNLFPKYFLKQLSFISVTPVPKDVLRTSKKSFVTIIFFHVPQIYNKHIRTRTSGGELFFYSYYKIAMFFKITCETNLKISS